MVINVVPMYPFCPFSLQLSGLSPAQPNSAQLGAAQVQQRHGRTQDVVLVDGVLVVVMLLLL